MTANDQTIQAKFEVVHIRTRNEETGYTVFEAKFTRYKSTYIPTSELIIVGNFVSIYEGDEFEGEGIWVNHDVYGYQFRVSFPKRIVPVTKKGIEAFIRRYVKGVGLKTARKIVDTFGEETLMKIEEDYKNLLQVGGISAARAKVIHDKLLKHKKFEEIATFVLSNGGGYKTALRIYDEFADAAIMKIRENPFILAKMSKIGFSVADKFAFNLNFPFDHHDRVKEAVLFMLHHCSVRRGDLFVSSHEIKHTLSDILEKYGSYKGNQYRLEEKVIEKALVDLREQGQIVTEFNHKSEECVYLKQFHYMESRIVMLLKKLVEEPRLPLCEANQIQAFVDQYEKLHDFTFAEKQKSAIHMALLNGISILTGGPGTGKTQTINSIIQCVKYVKPDAVIHLFAPTGKASKRMSELTGMDAMTIHRGIGINYGDLEADTTIVEGDLLVIDETSMMDAYVCYRLLESVDENIRILFVGDYEQLPSVGVGLILRDLINSGKIPTTRLTEIFRQAQDSQIVMNAHRIINGETTSSKDPITFDKNKNDFYFFERPNRMDAQRTIIECVKRFINNQGYSLDDIQILSPMRKGDLGVLALNRIMQSIFNPRSEDKAEIKLDELNFLREGDKVIHTVNNKDLGVFNGEVGRITRIWEDADDGLQMEVEFDDGKTVIYDQLTVEEVELAYVLTIHKSQGSEYPIVIMPIHPSQEVMLTKNLIYTGWTRAKQKVVNVGVKSALDRGVQNVDNTIRNSRIEEKIRMEIASVA